MEPTMLKRHYPFLEGGGEMGELTRNFNWELTAVGSPEIWPESLRRAVSNLLHSRFPMFLWWGEDMIQFYNDGYRPSLGNKGKHPKALGQKAIDCWTEIWPVIFPLIQGVKATGKSTWNENQLIPIYRNGKMEDVYWTFSYSQVLDDEYKHGGILVTCIETTEAVNGQFKIAQSENNLRNMILQAPVAMAILKGSTYIVEIANEHMYELWGKQKDEVINRSIFKSLPGLHGQGFDDLLKDVYTTGKTFTAHGKPLHIEKNGLLKTVYVDFLYEAFREGDGTISGIMVVATDVTEQVIARMNAEENNKEFKFLTDFMPQMIWATKPDGYHDFYNKQWYDYTGLSYDETKDTGWNNVFHPDDQQRAWKVWRHSLETGEPYEIEYRCRRFDGEYRWVLGRALPLKDESGKILKWFGSCTDIHDQKVAADLLEEKVKERTKDLEEANAHLKQLNAELEQFTFVSHHDLQEPLRKIILYTGMVKEENYEQLTGPSKIKVDKIIESGRRMSAALRDVMNYAGLSLEEQLKTVDLNQVILSILADLELVINGKNARISYENLPVINAVPQQMHQLFYNLINNALKFSRPGELPVINITSSLLSKANVKHLPGLNDTKRYYEIIVADNGIGFRQDAAEKIFGMFQRLHGKEAFTGTGIGLALCKKVVANHQGVITAEGTEGVGAIFKIYLPVSHLL